MTSDFIEVSSEGFSVIAEAIGKSPSALCDFTPFVLLTWQRYYKTAYLPLPSGIALRYEIDGSHYYTVISDDPAGCLGEMLEFLGVGQIALTLIDEGTRERLHDSSFKILAEEANDAWMDYIYLHGELSLLTGKKFAGQRNHINKFISNYPDWQYERITGENIGEVLEFFRELTKDAALNETALYEREMLIEYMTHRFGKAPLPDMTGGLIRARGEIVSFAFGEVLQDTLFVHTEKARRDVQGAYQMIVREFARDNPANLINREEDMGIEGLRVSKSSYHPIKKEKKYNIIIEK